MAETPAASCNIGDFQLTPSCQKGRGGVTDTAPERALPPRLTPEPVRRTTSLDQVRVALQDPCRDLCLGARDMYRYRRQQCRRMLHWRKQDSTKGIRRMWDG